MGITIEEVIERLTRPVGVIENTVDTLKFGSLGMEVTGIAVSFMPTYNVIKKANEMGTNLLITHEGVFYSHWDNDEFEHRPVYDDKYKLINDSGIAIYRFHDYWHRYQPDGIMQGLLQSLEWESYVEKNQATATVLTIPSMTVKEIAAYVKRKLGIDFVRSVGEISMPCTRIGLLVGYRGSNAITLFENENLDLVIYGEGPEWETPEYVRDSICFGKDKSLIVLGHAESEEPGMKYLTEVLDGIFPSIPIHFVPVQQNFQVL